MTIHEFGKTEAKTIVLIHPSLVMWDYFENLVPLLEEQYHLIIPALPGYDEEQKGDFSSVEEIADELETWLIEHNLCTISCIYGCSMGGSVVLKMLANARVSIETAVVDGGITPYQLPWILTRFIALRDFFLVYLGKLAGPKLLEKAFSTDDYSKEDLEYVATVLRMISAKTIWRTFESCNNYKMPGTIHTNCRRIEYWLTDAEKSDRNWDVAYVRKVFPQTVFRIFTGIGHGGMAVLQPKKMKTEFERLIYEEISDVDRVPISP